jgi:multidrug resistance efflux pump
VEVHVREGDQVRKGDLLVRLNTERIDNDIAKQRQFIQASEQELSKLDQTQQVLKLRYEAAKAKSEAELAQAQEEIQTANQRRDSTIRLAKVGLQLAEDELRRAQKLVASKAIAEAELVAIDARYRESRLTLQEAQIAVDQGRLSVLQQALQLVDKEHAIDCVELDAKRESKRSELAAAELELANLL